MMYIEREGKGSAADGMGEGDDGRRMNPRQTLHDTGSLQTCTGY